MFAVVFLVHTDEAIFFRFLYWNYRFTCDAGAVTERAVRPDGRKRHQFTGEFGLDTNSPDATAYIIERKVLGTSSYGTIATVPKADKLAYSDNTIDPYATYLYRVRATRQPAGQFDYVKSFDEVIVGPPPPGMSSGYSLSAGLNLYDQQISAGERRWLSTPMVIRLSCITSSRLRTTTFHSFLEFVSWKRASYRSIPRGKSATIANAEGSGPVQT